VGSLILPFITISWHSPSSEQIIHYVLPQIQVSAEAGLSPTYEASHNKIDLLSVVIFLTFLSVGISIFKFIQFSIQLISILKIKIVNKCSRKDGFKIIRVNGDISPFSFFRWIFIPERKYLTQEEKTIIAHEEVHARQMHSFDIILSEIFFIILWWNPLTWLIKKEIRINLEYLADEGVLKKGFEPRHYQYLLLKITNPNTGIQIVNNFNVSQLKKRIIMINKQKSQKILSIKYLLTFPVILFSIFLVASFNSCSDVVQKENVPETVVSNNAETIEPVDSKTEDKTYEEPENGEVYTVVDEMPMFPEGEKALLSYIRNNLKYPDVAIANNTEGLVVARFTVSKTGNISDVEILRSVSPECDEEAIRVIKNMPQWQPGKQKGEPVAVYYTLPIGYKLQKS